MQAMATLEVANIEENGLINTHMFVKLNGHVQHGSDLEKPLVEGIVNGRIGRS